MCRHCTNKTQAQLRQDVKELDGEIGGSSAVPQGGPATHKALPAKSIVKVKAEKLEKMRLLRLAQQVCVYVCVCAVCVCGLN